MKINELKYSKTNTYLIEGDRGKLLFDTGWAGSFPAFCSAIGEIHIPVQAIDYILISHFHPDHMGIAQEIADLGATVVVMDVQKDYIHAADSVFEKEKNAAFIPVDDSKVKIIGITESREFLQMIGIDGEIVSTPGHTPDSISLYLDTGDLFVGDLNPLYELALHRGTRIEETWDRLLKFRPKMIYYGHARAAAPVNISEAPQQSGSYKLVSKIMRYIDKGVPLDRVQRKTGADRIFIEDVARMYLTHQNVGVQGILDRIEIKGR